MIIKFTPEQIAYLNSLKDSGCYRKKGYERIYADTLFYTFAEGCRIKNISSFYIKQFQIDYPCNRSDADRRGHGCHSDMSEVLSRGEILVAMRYGNKNKLIEKVGHRHWKFTRNICKNKGKIHTK